MQAISVRQPHAHHIVTGDKTIELRNWTTSYRGHLLICASRRVANGYADLGELPRGCVVGVVSLIDVLPYDPSHDRHAMRMTDAPYKYSFIMRDPVQLPCVPIVGRMGLFTPSRAVLRDVAPFLSLSI